MNRHILIVGQGITGTVLSWELSKKGIPHKVLDKGHKNSASFAAAGLINPITGRRYVKSWMVDELLQRAKKTYSELEQYLDLSFVKEKRILRTFHNLSQMNLWNESTSRPGYAEYVDENASFSYNKLVSKPYGFGCICQGLIVDLKELIQGYNSKLQTSGDLLKGSLDYASFNSSRDGYEVQGQQFTDIVFSEGHSVIRNPYFSYLPFQPAKGESLVIQIDSKLPEDILRDSIFIVPLTDNTFWTGGGYDKSDLNPEPTAQWRDDWQKKLDALLRVKYEVVSHSAGIRPSVIDRRPLIGTHADHPGLHLFNGMGTKATSLVPYWAKQFVDYLLDGDSLSNAVSLDRFNN